MAHSLQRVGIGTLLLCGIGAVLLGLGVLLLDIAPGLRWLLLLLVGVLWTGLCLWRWRRRVRAYIEQWLPGVLERLGRVSGGALAVRFSEAEFPEELRALAAELNRLIGAVETQLSRVRTLERSHTELLGTLAHELRNPLFLLRGSVETALDSSDPAQREHLLQKSLQHIARMERLLEQLLELSRLESGTLPLRWRSIRLAPLCTELCNHFSLLAAQHEVTLHVEVPEELEVLADRDRLEQALANLLENAIKYNRPAGRSGCAPSRRSSTSSSAWRIPVSASRWSTRNASLSASTGCANAPFRGAGWDWRLCATSCRRTERATSCRASRAWAPSSASGCAAEGVLQPRRVSLHAVQLPIRV
jgi:signal transduction histidine kinase